MAPASGHTASETTNADEPSTNGKIVLDRFEDASAAVDRARALYLSGVRAVTAAFARVLRETQNVLDTPSASQDLCRAIAGETLDATYPVIVVRPYFHRLGLEDLQTRDAHDLRAVDGLNVDELASTYFATTVTQLSAGVNCQRLAMQLLNIQYGLQPEDYEDEQDLAELTSKLTEANLARKPREIYVGTSLTPIPLRFALSGKHIDDGIRQASDDYLQTVQATLSGSEGAGGNGRKGRRAKQARKREREVALQRKLHHFRERLRQNIQAAFAKPSLVDIDDRVVDGIARNAWINEQRFRLAPSVFDEEFFTRHRDTTTATATVIRRGRTLKTNPRLDSLLASPHIPEDALESGLAYNRMKPLSLYTALRVDYSVSRLEHYLHTEPGDIQPYILFTNYDRYAREFLAKMLLRAALGEGKLVVSGRANRDGRRCGLVFGNETREEGGSCSQAVMEELKKIAKLVSRSQDDDLQPEEQALASRVIGSQKGKVFHQERESIVRFLAKWVPRVSPQWLRGECQMPAMHFRPYVKGEPGVSLINIGVGPANSRTITDNLAVLRPRAWMVLGHCAGLRTTQKIGDYVLPPNFLRMDNALAEELPHVIDLPHVEEVQTALEEAVAKTKYERLRRAGMIEGVSYEDPPRNRQNGATGPAYDRWRSEELRHHLRYGTCMTTQNRHWELTPFEQIIETLEKSRAIAVDMESGTIAANGYRHRVPFGALLCISDKPLVGDLKMRDTSASFYAESTSEHLDIGIRAVKLLDGRRKQLLATRRLHGLDDPLLR